LNYYHAYLAATPPPKKARTSATMSATKDQRASTEWEQVVDLTQSDDDDDDDDDERNPVRSKYVASDTPIVPAPVMPCFQIEDSDDDGSVRVIPSSLSACDAVNYLQIEGGSLHSDDDHMPVLPGIQADDKELQYNYYIARFDAYLASKGAWYCHLGCFETNSARNTLCKRCNCPQSLFNVQTGDRWPDLY
jgi:hypothetical protein